MKVIDLAIGFSKGIIPPKIIYKGVIYEYFKVFKDYIRFDENGNIKTFQINVEQFNDDIEIIEDTPKEDEEIDKLLTWFSIDKDDNENMIREEINTNFQNITEKIDEIIDRLNGE